MTSCELAAPMGSGRNEKLSLVNVGSVKDTGKSTKIMMTNHLGKDLLVLTVILELRDRLEFSCLCSRNQWSMVDNGRGSCHVVSAIIVLFVDDLSDPP